MKKIVAIFLALVLFLSSFSPIIQSPFIHKAHAETCMFLEDGLGNIRFVLDSSGNKLASYDYDPFGNLRSSTLSNTRYQFQTQQLDPESGMYFLRARYYDPRVGRFISRDPVIGDLTNPQSQNSYAYSYNNPVNLSDPSGKQVVQVVQFCARSAIAGVNLAKSLASQQQMGEAGKVIAGPGAKKVFENASKVVQEYGGNVLDWVR